jgi:hypothetical protein
MLRPTRRLHSLRRVRVALLRGPVVWGTAVVAIALLNWGPGLIMDRLGSPVAPDGSLRRSALIPLWAAGVTYIALPVAGLVLGMRNLRASYRVASDAERRRVLWVVAGFSAAAWMILSAAGLLALIILLEIDADALGFAVPVALCLAPLVLVICAAIGVLHAGAIDSSLVLKRTTVWGALGALGVVAFAGIENALSSWIEGRLGLPGFIGPMVAGAVVAAALIPVRRPLSRAVGAYARRFLEPARAEETAAPEHEDAVASR